MCVCFRKSTLTRITPFLALRPPTTGNRMMNIMGKIKIMFIFCLSKLIPKPKLRMTQLLH